MKSPKSHKTENTMDANLVANTVKTWVGNPLSRGLLRLLSGNNGKGNRLDFALKRYARMENGNGDFDFRDRIAYSIVKFILDRGAKSFGISASDIRNGLRDDVSRRALVNVLEGIAQNGVRKPQVTAAPFLVVWNFTHACNLRCKHCYQNAGGFLPDELTTEEAKKVIDEFYESGVVAIAFSGGEPLLRNDFFEVAGYAKEKGFYVSIASNGTLITKEVAKKLKECVEYVEISLDGFEKEHDNFRGISGSWKKACRGIENCVKAEIDTCVATTVTRHNIGNIPKLADFVEKRLGVRRLIVFNFVPTRRGKDIIDSDISPQERQKLLEFLYSKLVDNNCKLNVLTTAPQYARIAFDFPYGPLVSTHFTNKSMMGMKGRARTLGEFIGGCGAARLYCGLEPNGDVQPCVFIPITIGNIRKDKIKELWRKSETLRVIRNREKFTGCGKCEYRYVCGGCRARAYGYFGDLAGPDPGCIHNTRYWEDLKSGKIKTAG